MKTEQLIPLCQRYQALLLDSNEHTIAIAVLALAKEKQISLLY